MITKYKTQNTKYRSRNGEELSSSINANKIKLQDTNGSGRGNYEEVPIEKRIEGEKRVKSEGWKLKEKEIVKEVFVIKLFRNFRFFIF